MRPVNLIPVEDRRGESAPLRSGPLAYILLGALVAVLAGVSALVLTDNQISEREADVERLTREDAKAQAKAERLVAYTQFRDLAEQRVSTVAQLADSRFDWERVMRELSLVLPKDVWLVAMTGTAAPGVTISGGGQSSLRAAAPGPALELEGCAKGQEAVARFVTALRDIDGVTRVGLESSELPNKDSGEGGGGSDGSSEECRTRRYISKFEIVASFDAAPISPSATEEGAAPPATTAPVEESDEGSDEGEEG